MCRMGLAPKNAWYCSISLKLLFKDRILLSWFTPFLSAQKYLFKVFIGHSSFHQFQCGLQIVKKTDFPASFPHSVSPCLGSCTYPLAESCVIWLCTTFLLSTPCFFIPNPRSMTFFSGYNCLPPPPAPVNEVRWVGVALLSSGSSGIVIPNSPKPIWTLLYWNAVLQKNHAISIFESNLKPTEAYSSCARL